VNKLIFFVEALKLTYRFHICYTKNAMFKVTGLPTLSTALLNTTHRESEFPQ